MPAASASSSWSGGQPCASPHSASPVSPGVRARGRAPASAIAASSAALRIVLPTPVSVAVMKSPRTPASRALGRARDAGLALAVVGGAARGGGGDIALRVIGGRFARREGGPPVARALDVVARGVGGMIYLGGHPGARALDCGSWRRRRRALPDRARVQAGTARGTRERACGHLQVGARV